MSLRQILVSLSFVIVASPASGAVTGWTDVVVRVYDANGVMTGTKLAALDEAAKTLEAASIEVIWRVCSTEARVSRREGAMCNAPLASGELAIRIVRSPVPPRYQGTLPLGEAMVDTRTGGGVLATIYIDRVEWLAREAGADSRALLGRAIAHELGHLLLATTTHGPVGLMRALWSNDEVRHGRARDWAFAPNELQIIRTRVETRTVFYNSITPPETEMAHETVAAVPPRGVPGRETRERADVPGRAELSHGTVSGRRGRVVH